MFDVDASILTHMGNVRTNNEDSVSLVRPNTKDDLNSHGILALVADGMGGHEGGELASKLAAETIARSYYRSEATPQNALAEAFREANREIFANASANPALAGMGTTCIAVAILEDLAWWAWVGDSRLYLWRDGQVFQMSEDHTVVYELIRRGLLTAEEARNHPERSVLARALGTKDNIDIALASEPVRLRAGDRLLLCSDGLHDLLADIDISRILTDSPPADCAEALLRTALDRGGFDNISLVLLEAKLAVTSAKRPASITREHVFG
jgi:PPM family protein phosphatase